MIKCYRPIKSNLRSQAFGESKACIKVDVWNRPIRPFIVAPKYIRTGLCAAGFKDFYSTIGLISHNGTDLVLWDGEPIYFPVKAPTAWYSKDASDADGGLGVDVYSVSRIYFPFLPTTAGVEAKRDWEANGKTIRCKFRFWHLSKTWNDEEVRFGELIGRGGSTGASSAPHLHWSYKFVDNNDRSFDTWNGWYGANDIEGLDYENKFVIDVINEKRVADLEGKIKEAELTLMEQFKKIMFIIRQITDLRKQLRKLGGLFTKL